MDVHAGGDPEMVIEPAPSSVVVAVVDPMVGPAVDALEVSPSVNAAAAASVQAVEPAAGVGLTSGVPLDQFLTNVAGVPPAPLLPTPAPRKGRGGVPVVDTRRSARLDKKKAKAPPGAGTEVVQELIAKV